MDQYMQRARTLIEALPYIKRFNHAIVVIKYGGSAMTNDTLKRSVIKDITLMKLVGMKPVVVHGGGNMISQMLQRLGKESVFVDGLRVTDDETMEIAEMVLSGHINKGIVQEFQQQGIKAVGISGKDGGTIVASRKTVSGRDIGWVGEIQHINPDLLLSLIDDDFIPVVAPIATDGRSNTYNINADYVASGVAAALHAEKLVYLTDVDGVLTDVRDSSSRITKIHIDEIPLFKERQIITGGMLPKIENCAQSIRDGVRSVHILDGRVEHSLLLEVFTNSGIGTMIHQEGGTS